jgi:hypothetical protein
MWLSIAIGALVAGCSSNNATPTPAGPAADAGADASIPPASDASTPPSDSGGTVTPDDGDIKATACTAAPFVDFTATLTALDVSGSTQPLAGAKVGFSTCTGFYVTTGATGSVSTQLTQGIPASPFYNDGTTTIGAIGAEIPATGNVAPAVTLFNYDVTPSIPGFQQDGGNQATIAIVIQVDPAATAPCNTVSGVTLSVTGHPEAVVSYASTGWPGDTAVTTTSSTAPYAFINGVTGGGKVAVTGAMSGCSVKLVTESQTGNFQLLSGSVTIGLATVTN